MSQVHLEFLSWLRDMVDIEGISDGVIIEQKIEEKKTVRHLVNQLAVRYNRFGQVVFDVKSQKLTGRVSIFLNGCHLELLNGLETNLKDGDVLTFVPPIKGG